MIKQLVALFALVALTEASAMDNVVLSLVRGLAMVQTRPDHYGLSEPALAPNSWKTVSVNGPEATIYSSTCEKTVKQVSDFTQSELDLLNQTQKSVEISQPGEKTTIVMIRSGIFRVCNENAYLAPGTDIRRARFSRKNDSLVQKIDADNYSVEKSGLANNLNGVYVTKELVSFVYNDDKVLMKPIVCLETDELELLEQLKSELSK